MAFERDIVTRKDIKIADFVIDNANIVGNGGRDGSKGERVNRNFSGFPQGAWGNTQKFFTILLDPELAEVMKKDNWRINEWVNKENPDDIRHYFKVIVDYSKPWNIPDIVVEQNGIQTELDADSVGCLDKMILVEPQVTIRAWPWEKKSTGETGVTAYCQSLYARVGTIGRRDRYFGSQQPAEEEVPF